MLSELVYISRRTPTCTDYDVTQILQASTQQNKKRGVTGVLLYSKTQFIQILEGDNEAIVTLYDHIKKDKRHRNAFLISLRPIERRYFTSWQMGTKKMDENYEFLTPLNAHEKEAFKELLMRKNFNQAIDLMHKVFRG